MITAAIPFRPGCDMTVFPEQCNKFGNKSVPGIKTHKKYLYATEVFHLFMFLIYLHWRHSKSNINNSFISMSQWPSWDLCKICIMLSITLKGSPPNIDSFLCLRDCIGEISVTWLASLYTYCGQVVLLFLLDSRFLSYYITGSPSYDLWATSGPTTRLHPANS